MKTREGFVSNSSSSSFIISESTYVSVFDVAKTMIPVREWADDSELIKKIEDAEIKGMDNNTSICFDSCNFDTYIVKYKGYYLISTCNNHCWDDSLESLGYFPEELKNIVNDYEGNCGSSNVASFEDLEQVVPQLSSFWYPVYNVGGIPVNWDHPDHDKYRCKKHYGDLIRINSKKNPVCVQCYGEALNKKRVAKEKKKFSSMSLLEKISYVEDSIVESSMLANEKKKIFEVLEEAKRSVCGS